MRVCVSFREKEREGERGGKGGGRGERGGQREKESLYVYMSAQET